MTDEQIQQLIDRDNEPEVRDKPLGWRPSDYRQGRNAHRYSYRTSPGLCLECGARTLKGVCGLCS